MGSRPGRKHGNLKTPRGQILRHVIHDGFSQGLRGLALASFVEKKIEVSVIKAIAGWESLSQKEYINRILQRGDKSHRYDNENPFNHPIGKEVAPAAAKILRGDHPYKLWEVDALVDEQKVVAPSFRKNISAETKKELKEIITTLGGRCPCCGIRIIINYPYGSMASPAEYDHFYQNQLATPENVWLICKQCHSDLTHGRIMRTDVTSEFQMFQKRYAKLTGRHPK